MCAQLNKKVLSSSKGKTMAMQAESVWLWLPHKGMRVARLACVQPRTVWQTVQQATMTMADPKPADNFSLLSVLFFCASPDNAGCSRADASCSRWSFLAMSGSPTHL